MLSLWRLPVWRLTRLLRRSRRRGRRPLGLSAVRLLTLLRWGRRLSRVLRPARLLGLLIARLLVCTLLSRLPGCRLSAVRLALRLSAVLLRLRLPAVLLTGLLRLAVLLRRRLSVRRTRRTWRRGRRRRRRRSGGLTEQRIRRPTQPTGRPTQRLMIQRVRNRVPPVRGRRRCGREPRIRCGRRRRRTGQRVTRPRLPERPTRPGLPERLTRVVRPERIPRRGIARVAVRPVVPGGRLRWCTVPRRRALGRLRGLVFVLSQR